MTNSKSAVLMVLGAMIAMAPALGCDCNCDPPDPMESGDYVIVPRASGHVHPGDEWLVGGQLHVDREAEVATIRYTREGTTYEVRYTLEP
jgi:hypothetical protein